MEGSTDSASSDSHNSSSITTENLRTRVKFTITSTSSSAPNPANPQPNPYFPSFTEDDEANSSHIQIPYLPNSWSPSLQNNNVKNDTVCNVNNDTVSSVEKETGGGEGVRFKNEMDKHASDTSVEAYERVPVHQFGEAVLKSMGWNPDRAIGIRGGPPPLPYTVPVRASRLGLGATLKTKS